MYRRVVQQSEKSEKFPTRHRRALNKTIGITSINENFQDWNALKEGNSLM